MAALTVWWCAVLAVVSLAGAQESGVEECGACDPVNCPTPPAHCHAGMVKDRCECCMVCGQKEGQLCDLEPAAAARGDRPHRGRYGKCGDDLECRPRPDSRAGEALCYCRYTETICGTDGNTYGSLCKLMEAAYALKANDSDVSLKVERRGPCESAPWLETASAGAVEASVGEDVVLTCEVMGYPIPAVQWTVTGYDGNDLRLPSDMDHIAVQARGGPEQYEVTSWLQIQGVTPTDEGEYVCTGDNSLGSVQARVRLTVTDKEKYMDSKEFGANSHPGYNNV